MMLYQQMLYQQWFPIMFSLSSAPLSTAERRSRLACLAAVTTPLAGALLYNQGYPVSWLVCPIRSLTGIPCPTCGMTRSLMAVARGEWGEAIGYHAFGPLLFLILLVAALHLLLELGLQRRVHAVYERWLRNPRWQIILLSGFLLYYAIRLHHWVSSGDRFAAAQ